MWPWVGCTVWHSEAPSARNCYLCLLYNWFHPAWLLCTGARLDSRWQHSRPVKATCNIFQFVLLRRLSSNLPLREHPGSSRSPAAIQRLCCNKCMYSIMDISSWLLLEKGLMLQYLPHVTDLSHWILICQVCLIPMVAHKCLMNAKVTREMNYNRRIQQWMWATFF